MCGRYSLGKKPKVWPEETQPFIPRFNIAPGQDAPVLVDKQSIQSMHWGLVPWWARSERTGYRMINARAETLLEKRAFRNCVRNQRCLIPADSFYEWRRDEKRKQPFRILMRDGEEFVFAGLRDKWTKPDGGTLHSFTIITTEANELVRPIHDRMPAILARKEAEEWMNGKELTPGRLAQLLRPFSASLMRRYAVSPGLNNALEDDPALIEPFLESEPMLPGLDNRK